MVVSQRFPNRRAAVVGSRAVAAGVLLGSALVMARFAVDSFLPPVASPYGPAGEAAVSPGSMSPTTAAALFLSGGALALAAPGLAQAWLARQIAALLGAAAGLTAVVGLLGHAAGTPLISDGVSLPMAFTSAAGVGLIACGLVVMAGPDTWPLLTFSGRRSAEGVQATSGTLASGQITAFALLSAAIGLAGAVYLRSVRADVHDSVFGELTAVARLEAKLIANWYEQKRADAEELSRNPGILHWALRVLSDEPDPAARDGLLHWMEIQRKLGGFRRLVLYDASGEARLATRCDDGGLPPPDDPHLEAALRSVSIVATDLHLDYLGSDGEGRGIHLAFWVPVLDEYDWNPRGVFLLQVDPFSFLYPLVSGWPVPVKTSAETVLVRRDGDHVLFLSDVRRLPHSALSLRLPTAVSGSVAAARAVLGAEERMAATDYRGVPVLAVAQPVPGTRWFLVAKIDRDEVDQPLKERGRIAGLAILLAISSTALGLSLFARRRETAWLEVQLESRKEREALAERLACLSRYANDAILLADQEFRILEANERAAEMYGYSMEELRRMTVLDLRAPETRSTFERDAGVVRQGSALIETINCRRDGSRFPVEVNARMVRLGGGEFFLAIVRDVTDRKKADEALIRSEARFRSTLDSLMEGGEVIGFDWRYLYVNDTAEKHARLPRESMLGKRLMDVHPGIEGSELFDAMRRSMENRTPVAVETRFVYPDGSAAWFDVRIQPVQEGIFVLSVDTTERKRYENALEERVRERTSQLEAANSELESFAYSVSHDLRAPLRGIDGWSTALLEDYGDVLDEKARKYLDRVRSEAQHMGSLIDDLLQLSRVTRGELRRQQVDITALARSVADRLLEEQPGRDIEFRIEPRLIGSGDRRLLEVALTNLLSNSVKFTARRDRALVEVGAVELDGERAFFVRDNGVGFEMKFAAKLFAPFQRLHKASEFPGTGIGLATVQRVVHRHGGRIWAESEVDRGAVFYFTTEPRT